MKEEIQVREVDSKKPNLLATNLLRRYLAVLFFLFLKDNGWSEAAACLPT